MLALLRSDLYRAWHRSDSFWTLLVSLMLLTAAGVGLTWFLTTPTYADFAASMGSTATAESTGLATVTAAPTYLWGQTLLSGGLLGLITSAITFYNVMRGTRDGFCRTVLASLRSHTAFYLEKFVLAGVHAAIVTLVGVIIATVCQLVVGFRFTGADSGFFVFAWIVLVWLVNWAMSAITLLVVLTVRNEAVGWFCAVLVVGGTVESLLVGAASLTRSEPLIVAVSTFCSWLPRANFMLLAGGGSEGGYVDGGALALDGSMLARVALSAAGVLVVCGVAIVLGQRRRDVA